MTSFVRAFSWLIGRFGKDEGAVLFEICGLKNGAKITHRIAIVARRDGGLIPSVLAGIAVEKILADQLEMKGVIPIHKWIAPQELISKLEA